MPFSLGSSVKLSQLKYTLSENQGLISVDVLHIGESDTSVKVKLLLGDQNDSSVAFGKLKNFISQGIGYVRCFIYAACVKIFHIADLYCSNHLHCSNQLIAKVGS